MAETIVATTSGTALPGGSFSTASRSSSRPLAKMAGIERRNEKRAAVSRVSPANNPPMMVEPERLAPGINASTRAAPPASPPPTPRASLARRARPHRADDGRTASARARNPSEPLCAAHRGRILHAQVFHLPPALADFLRQ